MCSNCDGANDRDSYRRAQRLSVPRKEEFGRSMTLDSHLSANKRYGGFWGEFAPTGNARLHIP